MIKSPNRGVTESLLEAMRIQIQTRRRLRELQALRHPTDDQRDEAWLLLRAVRTLATENRRLRLQMAQVRLGALGDAPAIEKDGVRSAPQ